jgi:uncharacterized protein (DUF305 family)
MKKWALTVGVAALAAFVSVAECSNSRNQANQTSTTTVVVTSPSSSGAQPHNQADITFAQQMIPHHQQAIQMSDIILAKQGIDPRVIDLANQIKAAQGPEIQQMQGWLTQWGQPLPPSSSMMPSGGMVPGMMSDQEMTALQNADGVQASKQFLTMIIQHHQGAITMAQTEQKSGQNPPALTLAQSIITSQQQQIDTMQSTLAAL